MLFICVNIHICKYMYFKKRKILVDTYFKDYIPKILKVGNVPREFKDLKIFKI